MSSRQSLAPVATVRDDEGGDFSPAQPRYQGDYPSLWSKTVRESVDCSSLIADIDAQVAVVGAGVAGLSTALHLAEAGISVVVLEAGKPGDGATGASGGLLAPDFISQTPQTIIKQFGEEAGLRLIKLVGGSARLCFDIVERHGIDCGAVNSGFYCPAHTTKFAEFLQNKAEEWRVHGYDVQYLDSEMTSRSLGTDFYHGSLTFADGGGLNPLAYARGLARASQSAGADIYCDSPVRSVSHDGTDWRLVSTNGVVRARQIVLAANGGNIHLHPALRETALPMRVYEFATAPLTPDLRASIVPEGITFTDRQPYLFTARVDESGRLVSAFPAFLTNRSRQVLLEEASRRISRYFPSLAEYPIEYLWEGTAWINPSLLPKIHSLGQGGFAIQACNGRGLAINTALGKQMADALSGGQFDQLAVTPETAKPIRGYGIARHLPALTMAAARCNSRLKERLKP